MRRRLVNPESLRWQWSWKEVMMVIASIITFIAVGLLAWSVVADYLQSGALLGSGSAPSTQVAPAAPDSGAVSSEP